MHDSIESEVIDKSKLMQTFKTIEGQKEFFEIYFYFDY